MTSRALIVVWLTFVWVMLWGEVSVGNVLGGLILGVLIVAAFPPGAGHGRGLRPLAVVGFGLWFAKELVIANVTVAAQIVRPRLRLEQGIVAVPLRTSSPLITTFVANTISLTPGTLTVEIRPAEFGVQEHDVGTEPTTPPVLYVHCLVTGDPDQVRADGLALEQRVVRAFGTAADLAAVQEERP
jgi:multicomponent Na+:H+ antiporter subunit E